MLEEHQHKEMEERNFYLNFAFMEIEILPEAH